jgi:hypothetical protein
MSTPNRVRAALRVAAIACAAAWSPGARATVNTNVHGIVRDEAQLPLAAARLVLRDAEGNVVAHAISDERGEFLFRNVDAGDYAVDAHADGRIDDCRRFRVGSADVAELELYLIRVSAVEETVVKVESPGAPMPQKTTGTVSTLSRAELRALPKGEDRPINEVLTTQPGFIADAFGNVYARGNHANIQYQLDGVPIPDSVGNLFAQAIPVRLIENLEIMTGGMPAEFGYRLASVVNITTRHGGDQPEGLLSLRYGSFQTIEPSGYYSRSVGRFGFFVGGSYQQTERALDPPAIAPILHDDGRNGRAFLRVDWRKSERDRVELFASYSHDFFQIPIDPTVAPVDPSRPDLGRPVDQYGNASPPFVPHDTNATETEQEFFATVSWIHALSQRMQLQVAPYYKLSYGALLSDPTHALGALADPGATASDVTRSASHVGAVAHWSMTLGGHLLKAGVQADYLIARTDYAEYVRDDASPDGGIDPLQGGRGVDRTQALLTGMYVQDRWDRGRFALHAGIRIDEQHVALSGGRSDDQFGTSPRLGASFTFRKWLVGHAFVGINWQPPTPLDAANAARILGVIPAGAQVPYDVKAETDLFAELGLDARPWKPFRISGVGWGRYAWNQSDDTIIGSTTLVTNYNFARGYAYGLDTRADLAIGSWLRAFVNLSVVDARGQDIASAKFLFAPDVLADHSFQTLDHVQTVTANGGLVAREGGFAATLLANYGSGLRTGPLNDQHVPEHVRFDVTMQYAFASIPLRPILALDVINLFDAHYAYRIANGFVGSSYAAPRSIFVRLSIPLNRSGT